jgi:hypothetical protein
MCTTCPHSASSGFRAEFHEVFFYQKHTNPLNCRTSSSDISWLPRGLSRRTRQCRKMAGVRYGMCELTRHGTSRHGMARHGTARHGTARHGTARHGTARERHGRGMGAAWARHGMCELPFTVPHTDTFKVTN